MIAPFVEETLQAIHIALHSADLTASQVEEILLVGGATRTPMIRRRLARGVRQRAARRGRCRSVRRDGRGHPGRGDRRHGGLGRAGRRHALYLRHQRVGRTGWRSLSVSLRPDHPAQHADPGAQERGVLHRGATTRPRSTCGSSRARTRTRCENIQIGEFRVEGLSKAPAGNPVMLDLALDRDGILQVVGAREDTPDWSGGSPSTRRSPL